MAVRPHLAALSVITLMVAGWVGYVVTGRLLRPLGSLRSATEQITVDNLEHRIVVPAGRDDIAALARNFNRMLGRIQAGFAEQRRFMSDVGHELRTPLTIVRGTLETTDVEDPARTCARRTRSRWTSWTAWAGSGGRPLRAGRLRASGLRAGAPRLLDLAGVHPLRLRAHRAHRRARMGAGRAPRRRGRPTPTSSASPRRSSSWPPTPCATATRAARIRFGVDRVLGPEGPEIHVSDAGRGRRHRPVGPASASSSASPVWTAARGSGSGLGLPIVLAIAEGHGGVVRLLLRARARLDLHPRAPAVRRAARGPTVRGRGADATPSTTHHARSSS